MTTPTSDNASDRTSDSAHAAELRELQRHFLHFAEGQSHLTLYRSIALGVAQDAEAVAPLLAAMPGQARPMLFLAALHDVVLRNPHVRAARWYTSVVGRDSLPSGDPWPDIRATILEHADELSRIIAIRRTQTNEVNRAVYVATGVALAARDVPRAPTVLVELGTSAGLLLQLDRYRIELVHELAESPGLSSTSGRRDGSDQVLGDPGSVVTCHGEDRSPIALPRLVLPPIAARTGLDLSPVDPGDEDAVRWLEACLWPDVPGRVERFRAAMQLLRADPPSLRSGDMVDDLGPAIESALSDLPTLRRTGAHVVVFSSWALTYVEEHRREAIGEVLAGVAADGRPVSWMTAEPTGCAPNLPLPQGVELEEDTTVLGARRWREGRELPPEAWGTCHPHGEWVLVTAGAPSGTAD